MADNGRSAADVRRDLETEREELAGAVDELRREVGAAADVKGKLKRNLPGAMGAAAGVGFVLAGGIGATMRYFARRGRDADEKLRFGRFSFLDRG